MMCMTLHIIQQLNIYEVWEFGDISCSIVINSNMRGHLLWLIVLNYILLLEK